jgi:transposase
MSRYPLPVIAESAQELLEMRRTERDERRRERLHALWLLASGEVAHRLALAKRLGRNRETVSRWLADYVQGGLSALLRAPLRPGPPSQGGIGLSAGVQQAIRARLAQPQGERGYLALWRWARAEHALPYSYSHFYRWVHDRLGATLKVARKSHGQKKRTNFSPTKRRA